MSEGLIKLAQEDPSFHFSRDEETNQTVIEGMGELHLVSPAASLVWKIPPLNHINQHTQKSAPGTHEKPEAAMASAQVAVTPLLQGHFSKFGQHCNFQWNGPHDALQILPFWCALMTALVRPIFA